MPKVRVCVVGVGNAASALIQGVYYYRDADENTQVPGLSFIRLGPYHVGDIEFVAAFDVDRDKVGRDLSEAIFVRPNMVPKFADVPKLGVNVLPAPKLDGVAPHMEPYFKPADVNVGVDEVVDHVRSARPDLILNLLPVGSEEATRFWARVALESGVAFVNGIPVFIASDPDGYWQRAFEEAGIPLVGDDIKGQVGATILHRTLVRLLHMRGVRVEETYQLNIGGNTDFLNMIVEERLRSKRISKTEAVTSVLPYGKELEEGGKIRIGPSDYIPFLGNTKVAYIYIKGRSFADFPITLEVKLSVDDKSMIAGSLIDAVRATKIAVDRHVAGPVPSISAYLFKHPPIQAGSDEEAREWFIEFIKGNRVR